MPESKKEIFLNVDHDGMSTKGKQEGARKYSQWSGLKAKVVTELCISKIMLRRLPGKSLCDECIATRKKMQQGIRTNLNDFVRNQIVEAKAQRQTQ